MCVDLANCGGDCPECQLEGGRTKIDEGEIRYEFEIHRHQPSIIATFRGPRMGTAFEMTYEDARQMRDDLENAMAAFKGFWPRRDDGQK